MTFFHPNISLWVSQAAEAALAECKSIVRLEIDKYHEWASHETDVRLRQLCTELLAQKLHDVSDGKWTSIDFMGPTHSSIITKAINRNASELKAFYRSLLAQQQSSET